MDRSSREPAASLAAGGGELSPAADAVRLGLLQSLTTALSRAGTPDEVAAVALERGLPLLGGVHGLVLVHAPGGDLRVLGSAQAPEACVARLASASATPALDALRHGTPVFVQDAAASRAGCGSAEARCAGAVAALPLASRGKTLGVLVICFQVARAFTDVDRAFASVLADACAQALDRARLVIAERLAREEAVAAQRRLALLDGVSAHLAISLDGEDLLGGVARLAAPSLGDWAGFFVEGERGPERVAEWGLVSLGDEVEARLGALPRRPLVDATVLEAPPGAPSPRALAVPLAVGGRTLGVFALASADPDRRHAAADLALASDVARRTALALAHARALRDARSAARVREEFLHVASHELRGPLGTLRLGVQLLLRDARTGGGRPPQGRLHMIERQADRLVRLADALLDVSRITAGRLELSRERADLSAVVRDVVARHAEEASEAGAPIGCELPEALPAELDVARVEQVLSNLLSNAVKYGRGRPIQVTLGAEGAVARLSVRDHGIGIAEADQARIFDRFERAVSGRHYSGLGLGLWIVRQIVEAHGGAVRVGSTPGAGSTFVVELPLVAPA